MPKKMTFDISFTRSGKDSLANLEHTEQVRVRRKLEEIACSQFRHPRDWDFCQMEGFAEGRFGIGDGLRAFVDIDESSSEIRVHYVGQRENLYR